MVPKLEDGTAILTAGYTVRSAFLDVLLSLQLTRHVHPSWVYLSFLSQGKLEDGAAILTATSMQGTLFGVPS